jgi:hypothetical protein
MLMHENWINNISHISFIFLILLILFFCVARLHRPFYKGLTTYCMQLLCSKPCQIPIFFVIEILMPPWADAIGVLVVNMKIDV